MRIEGGIRGRVGRAHAEGAIAGSNGRRRAILHAHAWLDPWYDAACVVALAVIPRHATQDFVNRQFQHLAFDVPQRKIERAERMFSFAPRRIKERPRHVLPQPFDMLRVLPDQPPGTLFQCIGKTAFANTGDSRVGLDGHHRIGLIEQWVRVGGRISPYARDLHLRQCRFEQRKMRERVHSCRYRFQKESPFHKPPSLGGRERPVAAPEAPREHCFRTPLGHWRTYGRLQASNTSEADSQRKTWELWE